MKSGLVTVLLAGLAATLIFGCGNVRGDLGFAGEDEVDPTGNQQEAVKGPSSCAAEPNPVLIGSELAIHISGMPRATLITATIQDDAGQHSVDGTSDKDGTLSLFHTPGVLGGALVDVSVPHKKSGSRVLTSCTYAVVEADQCGNDLCESGEDCASCPTDCGACPPECGDGECNGDEDCVSCEADCGVCPPECGDGTCDANEDCSTCATDCGQCAPVCGDGACNGTEDCSSCEADCGQCAPSCGDGVCNGTEDCASCQRDCGQCAPVCGDGSCNGTEDCSTCATDCGQCAPVCGDGTCNGNEDCGSCERDCGQCAPVCGDGTCNGTEDCTSCETDCGTCTACTPASSNMPSGRHNAGKACRSCHNGRDKVNFTIAGTLYDSIDGTNAVEGATIHIIDARGREYKLITARNGNFYTKDTSITFPVTTYASKCPDTQQMADPVSQTDGDCNSCHTSRDRIHLP